MVKYLNVGIRHAGFVHTRDFIVLSNIARVPPSRRNSLKSLHGGSQMQEGHGNSACNRTAPSMPGASASAHIIARLAPRRRNAPTTCSGDD